MNLFFFKLLTYLSSFLCRLRSLSQLPPSLVCRSGGGTQVLGPVQKVLYLPSHPVRWATRETESSCQLSFFFEWARCFIISFLEFEVLFSYNLGLRFIATSLNYYPDTATILHGFPSINFADAYPLGVVSCCHYPSFCWLGVHHKGLHQLEVLKLITVGHKCTKMGLVLPGL